MSIFRRKPADYKTAETPKKREDPYAVVTGDYNSSAWLFPYKYKVVIYDEIRGPQRFVNNWGWDDDIEKYQVRARNRLFLTEAGADRWAKRHLGWYIRGVQHQNHKLIIEKK